jgi:hypothetical protein
MPQAHPAPARLPSLQVIVALVLGLWLAGQCLDHIKTAELSHHQAPAVSHLSMLSAPAHAASNDVAAPHGDQGHVPTSSSPCLTEQTQASRVRTTALQSASTAPMQLTAATMTPVVAGCTRLADPVLATTRAPAQLCVLRH